MSSPIIGTPIYSDEGRLYLPTISAGSWIAALPEENVQDPRLSLVARSTDATEASTVMEFDLKAARAIRVCAALLPNISKTGATIRWRGSNSAGSFGSPLFDSTAVAAWPSGVTAEDAEGLNIWSIYIADTATSAQHVEMRISDTANADGYVDAARVAICGGFQVTTSGLSLGAKVGFEDDSQRHISDGGAAIYDVRRRRRVFSGAIEHVPQADAIVQALGMQHKGGIGRQFMWIEDPSDSTYGYRRNFLATFKELDRMEWSYYNALGWPLNIQEEL